MPCGSHILIGIIEVQGEALHYIDEFHHVFRAEPDQIHRAFYENVLNEVFKGV